MEKCTNKTGHSSLDSLRKGKLRDMEFICDGASTVLASDRSYCWGLHDSRFNDGKAMNYA